ncbi:MAG: hypothetical protein HWE18_09995 [Gammaproteobacteria bacterium]|nr:hypothetical protein [Gammaproteobacteria bacterium]
MLDTERSILIWFSVAMIPTVIYSIIQIAFYSGLKNNFPKQWEHAGRPTIWSDGSWVTSGHVIDYLRNEKFRESNDTLGMEYCRNNRKAMILSYWLSIYSCGAFFIFLLITAYW